MSAVWRNESNGELRSFPTLDLVFKPLVAIGSVADEIDLLDAGLSPSLTSNTRSTAVIGSSMIFGSTRQHRSGRCADDFDDALHVGQDGWS